MKVCANVWRWMAPAMDSDLWIINGVVTPHHAKLLNIFMMVVLLKLLNAMEQLWDFNNNVTMTTKKLAIPMALISTEILTQADHTLMSAKTTGNNDFLNALRSEMKFLCAAA